MVRGRRPDAKLLARGASVTSVRGRDARRRRLDALPWRDFRPLYVRNQFRYLARHAPAGVRAAAWAATVAGAALRLALAPVVRADHSRADVAAAQVRVLIGLFGLGWRSALLPEAS